MIYTETFSFDINCATTTPYNTFTTSFPHGVLGIKSISINRYVTANISSVSINGNSVRFDYRLSSSGGEWRSGNSVTFLGW